MTASKRWAVAGGVLAGLLALVMVVGIGIARSAWLLEKIRAAIVEQAGKATGGKVEIDTLKFDWHTFTADATRFVIHGTEPAGDPALLSVERTSVELKVVSIWTRDVRLGHIQVLRPAVHLIVYPDGRTNLPQPRLATEGRPAAEMILDLKIARFDLEEGTLLLDVPGQPPRTLPWHARGDRLAAELVYDPAADRYTGHVSGAVVQPVVVHVDAQAGMERNRIVVSQAKITAPEGEIDLTDAVLNNFSAPVVTGKFKARGQLHALDSRLAGTAQASGDAHYISNSDYIVRGDVLSDAVTVSGIKASRLSGSFEATPDKIAIPKARASAFGGEVTASGDILNLTTVAAKGTIHSILLSQAAATQTKQPLPYDGFASGPFEVKGRLGALKIDTRLSLLPTANGAHVNGEIAAHIDQAASKIDLGQSWVELPHSRIDAAGTLGERLTLKLASTDPADFWPALSGRVADVAHQFKYHSLTFNGTAVGPLAKLHLAGHADVAGPEAQDHRLDSLGADFEAEADKLVFTKAEALYSGIRARGTGSLGLTKWEASDKSSVAATVEIAGADLTKLLELAGHKEVQVTGSLGINAAITGSLGAPKATADVLLAKGFIYNQPFDAISGRAQFIDRNAQSLTGLFVSGPKRVNISARFDHAGTQFPAGNLEFNLTSNTMPLNQIALVRQRQPDIRGFGKFHADGILKIGHDAKHELRFDLVSVNADASANGLELSGRNLGDARFTAQTRDAVLLARFDSNAANASIHGEGSVKLSADYPVDAKVKFTNAGLNSLAALISKASDARSLNFDGTVEAEATLAGPARDPSKLTASIDIPRIEFHPLPGTDLARSLPSFSVTNDGPIRALLSSSALRIESARLKAPETDVTVAGAVALQPQTVMNLRVQGNMNLSLAHMLSPDLSSSGALSLDATVRGDWTNPEVSGRAIIRNGAFHYADLSNGLTNANGEIVFNGTRANIQSLSAESGGGKVDATGFAALTGGLLSFRVEARAREVRVRYPEGVSSISDANLTFAGTSQRSEVSGAITVHRVAVNPKSDAATILAFSSQPLQTASAQAGLLGNMNLDVQITTAPDAALQTSVTESIQADASLRLRGTATNPAVLGRVNVTQGEVVFFGNKYTINQGTISFFNPGKIEPILNVDLETKARGVDVILTVSGPMNKLNVTYRSDPPLQFSDIVALLATGRTPTDPTIAGSPQGFEQLGASELVGQALANPVAGRLQRFFGVSRLKIDPQLTGITGSPQARLTVEQQVTPDILFTYITDVSSTSTQLIRVEWAFNRNWSAILIREENGYVGLDFAYRKRFR